MVELIFPECVANGSMSLKVYLDASRSFIDQSLLGQQHAERLARLSLLHDGYGVHAVKQMAEIKDKKKQLLKKQKPQSFEADQLKKKTLADEIKDLSDQYLSFLNSYIFLLDKNGSSKVVTPRFGEKLTIKKNASLEYWVLKSDQEKIKLKFDPNNPLNLSSLVHEHFKKSDMNSCSKNLKTKQKLYFDLNDMDYLITLYTSFFRFEITSVYNPSGELKLITALAKKTEKQYEQIIWDAKYYPSSCSSNSFIQGFPPSGMEVGRFLDNRILNLDNSSNYNLAITYTHNFANRMDYKFCFKIPSKMNPLDFLSKICREYR